MSVPIRIKEAREASGLSRNELAERLGLTPSAISNYENGIGHPKATVLFEIMKILGVDANFLFQDEIPPKRGISLTPTAQRIGCAYEAAPRPVQKTVEVALEPYMDATPVRPAADTELAAELAPEVRRRALPLHILPVSAGGGEFLDSNDFELVDVGPDVPMSANFGVRISGVSMAPRYPDGHIAWVRRSQSVEAGQVGVFSLNGDGYIKQRGDGELVSLNPACANVPLGEFDELRAFGVVVGVTSG